LNHKLSKFKNGLEKTFLM